MLAMPDCHHVEVLNHPRNSDLKLLEGDLTHCFGHEDKLRPTPDGVEPPLPMRPPGVFRVIARGDPGQQPTKGYVVESQGGVQDRRISCLVGHCPSHVGTRDGRGHELAGFGICRRSTLVARRSHVA